MHPLRIGLLGQSGPYTAPALEVLTQHEQPAWEITLLVESTWRHLGRHPFCWHAPNKPSRDRSVLIGWGERLGVPCLETTNINDVTTVAQLRRQDVDWWVCIGFDRLFSQQVISIAKPGAINAHPSKLPQWRGPAPIFWALRSGATSIHVSVHKIDAREDHGAVYASGVFAAPPRASGRKLYQLAGKLAGKLLRGVLDDVAQGKLQGVEQDHRLATRAPRPRPEDAYFDSTQWQASALLNFVCAAGFHRTPWTRLGDDVFFVRRGLRVRSGENMPAQYMLQGNHLWVPCVDGLVELEVQLPALSVAEPG